MNVAGIYQTDFESDIVVKTTVAVWIPWSSNNTTLYTTGLCYEHRHSVIKFSNISGTSTSDAVEKGRFNRP